MLYRAYKKVRVPWLGRAYGKTVRRWPRLAIIPRLSDGWRVYEVTSSEVRLGKGETTITIGPYHAGAMLSEILAWRDWYLPPSGLEGKSILDIGAGCGESAAFFFDHGAKKVVCVEPDREAAGLLRSNVVQNGWNALVIEEPFKLNQLSQPHDFLKFDAEGAETLLLDYSGSLGPCRIELHSFITGSAVKEALIKKFQLGKVTTDDAEIYGIN